MKPDAEPAARPGVMVGDEVYCHHPSGPHSGRVAACGKHGVTLETGNKVRWAHVLGHRRRASQEFDVVDEGEDGYIVRDKHGRRQFIAVAPDAREEQMIVKAGGGNRLVIFAKAEDTPYTGAPGLTKKVMTDRRGVQTTRWVRAAPDAKPPQVGHHVGWQNGDVRAHGQVVSVGRDGSMVRDKSGGLHAVRHEHVSHHWASAEAPGRDPHEPPARPDYAPRLHGESDKAYAKRAVDDGDAVHGLPEDHDRYFDTAGAAHVPLDKLHSTKTDDENQQGGDNGAKRMLAAYHGALGKRDPITVMPHATKTGHHEVVDGNGTLTSAKNMGWKSLPVKVVSRKDGERMMAENAAKDVAQSTGLKQYSDLPKKAKQPVADPDELFKMSAEGLEQMKEWLNKGKGVASRLGYRTATKPPDDMTAAEFDAPGGLLFIAKLKSEARSREKVESDYGGDWTQLTDVVRATMAADSLHDVVAAIKTLEAQGLKPMQTPKDKFSDVNAVGYRDFNFVVRLPNGIAAELQFNVKDMLRAKNEAHPQYEITRGLAAKYEALGTAGDPDKWEPDDATAYRRAFAAQRRIYSQAWAAHVEKHHSRAPKMVKSVPSSMTLLWRQT